MNTTRSKVHSIWSTSTHESQISLSLFYSRQFSSRRPFLDRCTEYPKMTLTAKGQKVPHVQFTHPTPHLPAPISLYSLYGQMFSSYRQFLDKYTEWSRNEFNH